MDIAESTLTIIAGILMVGTLVLSVLPFIPGPFMLWLISLGYALLTNFQHLTPPAMVVITIMMLIATSKDIWMPIVGMKTYGVSCSTAFGMTIGGLIGTLVVPFPLLGTLIGAIVGAVIMELLNVGDASKALRAGGIAFKAFILGMITEFGFNLLIVAMFFTSVLSTR